MVWSTTPPVQGIFASTPGDGDTDAQVTRRGGVAPDSSGSRCRRAASRFARYACRCLPNAGQLTLQLAQPVFRRLRRRSLRHHAADQSLLVGDLP
jgi:hypothetical protein